MMIYWVMGNNFCLSYEEFAKCGCCFSKKSLKVCQNASNENWGKERLLGETLYILVK
jgi:hypothetical protein